jgi:hypothetical protein
MLLLLNDNIIITGCSTANIVSVVVPDISADLLASSSIIQGYKEATVIFIRLISAYLTMPLQLTMLGT